MSEWYRTIGNVGLNIFTKNGKITSLETRTEQVVLGTYADNHALLEPIRLDRASKCKQTKEQDSKDCFWTHIFTFL